MPRPVVEYAKLEPLGVTTMMSVGDAGLPGGLTPLELALAVAGAALLLKLGKPLLWGAVGYGIAQIR